MHVTLLHRILDRGMVYYNWKFHTKKLCSRLCSIEVEFYSQTGQIRFLNHPLGESGVTYALYL